MNGEILTPRQRITSEAYSLQAQEAVHALNADTANGTVENGVSTTMIQDIAVSTQKLGDNAVTGSKIADGTITASKIVGGSGSGLDADLLDSRDSISFANASDLATLQATVAALQATVTAQATTIGTLQAKLQYVSVSGTEMHITGANLHIESGSGATDGGVNGLGNLIVGYNEPRAASPDQTGSHNLIVGRYHNYSSYGGLVAGYYNAIAAPLTPRSAEDSPTGQGIRLR